MAPPRGKDPILVLYWFMRISVLLFTIVVSSFDIYIIVWGFKWHDDFAQLSGKHSSDWNWTVAILVLTFLDLFSNGAAALVNGQDWRKDGIIRPRRSGWLGLFAITVWDLIPSVLIWVYVRPRNWADVLRAAGHASHADSVDIFIQFEEFVLIFTSLVSGLCTLMLLVTIVLAALGSFLDWWMARPNARDEENGRADEGSPDKKANNDKDQDAHPAFD